MSDIIIRPATAEDIAIFADPENRPTARAWAGEKDGEVLGVGGVAFVQGRWIAFVDVSEKGRKYKKTIMKAARQVFDELRDQGVRYIYATADAKEQNAVKWMLRLGFEQDARYGQFLRWKNGDT